MSFTLFTSSESAASGRAVGVELIKGSLPRKIGLFAEAVADEAVRAVCADDAVVDASAV